MPRRVSLFTSTVFVLVLAPLAPAQGTTAFCDPGQAGVIACPCANPPSGSGRGCDNSAQTGGAAILATGSPSLNADTLGLSTLGEPPSALSAVLQGTSGPSAGVVYGQGVRCVAGSLRRLYFAHASAGSIGIPQPGWSISNRSANVGDPISPGTHRYYLVYYRDPVVLGGCPATSTLNTTNAIDVLWQ